MVVIDNRPKQPLSGSFLDGIFLTAGISRPRKERGATPFRPPLAFQSPKDQGELISCAACSRARLIIPYIGTVMNCERREHLCLFQDATSH